MIEAICADCKTVKEYPFSGAGVVMEKLRAAIQLADVRA